MDSDNKKLFTEWANRTTAHGVARIVNSKTKTHRVFWILAFIFSVVVTIYLCSLRFIAYFEYNTVVDLRSITEKRLPFPAVTFCTFNKLHSDFLEHGHMRHYGMKVIQLLGDLHDHHGEEEDADELCDASMCSADEFHCLDDNHDCCVMVNRVCDGFWDCQDGSDEDPVYCNTTETDVNSTAHIPNIHFADVIREGGWKLLHGSSTHDNDDGDDGDDEAHNISGHVETTLMNCQFRGVQCTPDWFKHVFTSYGNCYTFNSEHILNEEMVSPLTLPLVQTQHGSKRGLSIMLNIQSEEYSESLENSGNSQIGLKFQIHMPGEDPDVESIGHAVSAGRHVYAGFSLTKVSNLEPPWGKCNSSQKLQYSDTYSYSQCVIECRLDFVLERCQCKPYYYPGSSVDCDAEHMKVCALPAIAEFDNGDLLDERCSCTVACESSTIDLKMSSVKFPGSTRIEEELNEQFFHTKEYPGSNPKFYEENIVSLNIYYEKLTYLEYKQMKAMDLAMLFSDLGGQLGLFIGVSVLTVCELFETILLAIMKDREAKKNVRQFDTIRKVKVLPINDEKLPHVVAD